MSWGSPSGTVARVGNCHKDWGTLGKMVTGSSASGQVNWLGVIKQETTRTDQERIKKFVGHENPEKPS
jgi:hypothetical protein